MRKLDLMPEVLPEPNALPVGTGDVRARTLTHLQRLLATAAAGGTLLACSREGSLPADGVHDAGTGIPTAATHARLDLPDAGVATVPTTSPVPPPTGYGVVDPVPVPAACPGIASEMRSAAMWAATPAGAVTVVLGVVPGTTDVISYGSGGTPSVVSGSLVSRTGTGKGQTLVVQPAHGTSSVMVSIPSHCNGRPFVVSLALDVTTTGRAGTPVPMSVSSY